ncbi:50S ribosomal protein L29 [Gammaproteobacteria bacterium]|jgi:large subunit ribosomal protein L29|nr:50S ribosomal protein L29 [Gammaproteobacteria bacterium]MDC0392503.1 50S ribosomal protein L29 [Gammaproteobacteria bacterium]MDC0406215.1 50S ribosomal protein L29 [Gammaproteobacteria bacterium]MDC0536124.1 50S ribosomal protein L29 [Gammaproteobacteria bacterium]MDC1149371.1 50S ribosomal protein L29 [Gammaproteobacteria bacterium]|tara:strand:+ start:1451 stop:1657 length:207 start_codon:yes stop_codon:yes gene_type:complete
MNKELQELRKKNIDQLNAELVATRQEQFNLRIKHKTGQLNETNQLTIARKKIAKIKTLMNELKSQDSK